MSEQDLNGAQIGSGFEQMRGEGVPQQVRMNGLGNASRAPRFPASHEDSEPRPIENRQPRAMAQIERRFQHGFDFVAAHNQRQFSLAPRKRNACDGDFPVQCMGTEEAQGRRPSAYRWKSTLSFLWSGTTDTGECARHRVDRVCRSAWKRPDGVQVEPDGNRGITADLEVFQHPLSQCGHNKLPSL